MGAYKYKAFISYSHKDERWARWLHRRLENYPIPTHLIGNSTQAGLVPKRLKPIFRDREELAAADSLGEKIEQALASSENLIIICSPNAAKSHWVNQEIISFKRQNRGAKIFSLIVDGEPFASNLSVREAEECFPSALRFHVDADGEITNTQAEPLAADIRTHADGKRLGLLKLVAGMVGVGLDEIVQRDMRRGRKRVMAITATSLATVLAMGTLTGFALNARKDADARRNDAEGLIEFMLTDLKDDLEAVGRLDALKSVGERAETYYDKYPLYKHNDEALGRRARVFHYLGRVQTQLGDQEAAKNYFGRAYESTKVLLQREKNNPDRVYDHAQSAYWLGFPAYHNEQYFEAEKLYSEYITLAKRLRGLEPQSLRALKEITYSHTNLGTVFYKTHRPAKAYKYFASALDAKKTIAERQPQNLNAQLDLVNAYNWLSDASLYEKSLSKAIEHRMQAYDILQNLIKINPKNYYVKSRSVSVFMMMGRLMLLTGELNAAGKFISEGKKIANDMLQQDQKNTKWGRSVLQLRLVEIELCLVQSKAADAKVLIEETEKILSLMGSPTEKQIYWVQQIKIELMIQKTHLSIANLNIDEAREQMDNIRAFIEQMSTKGSEHQVSFTNSFSMNLLEFILEKNCKSIEEEITHYRQKNGVLHPIFMAHLKGVSLQLNQAPITKSVIQKISNIDYGVSDIFRKSSIVLKDKLLEQPNENFCTIER